MKHLFRTAIVATLVALASQAQAQRAALVQDRDAPARSPYQERRGINQTAANCPNNFYCVITFNPVPAGYRLVITNASAEFTNGISGAGVAYVAGGAGLGGFQQVIPPGVVTPANRTVAAGPVTIYIEAGDSPTILLVGYSLQASVSSFGSLSGYLVQLP